VLIRVLSAATILPRSFSVLAGRTDVLSVPHYPRGGGVSFQSFGPSRVCSPVRKPAVRFTLDRYPYTRWNGFTAERVWTLSARAPQSPFGDWYRRTNKRRRHRVLIGPVFDRLSATAVLPCNVFGVGRCRARSDGPRNGTPTKYVHTCPVEYRVVSVCTYPKYARHSSGS